MNSTAKRAALLASAFALFAGSQLDYQPSPEEYNGTPMKKYRKKPTLTKKQQKLVVSQKLQSKQEKRIESEKS